MSNHYDLPSVNCKVVCNIDDMDMYARHYIRSNVSAKAIATGLAGPDQGQNEQVINKSTSVTFGFIISC